MHVDQPAARGHPRVLVSTAPLLFSPLRWTLDVFADAGFTGAELLFGHNPDTRNPETVAEQAEQAGLEVPVVHGPYMLLLRTVFGSGYQAKTERSLEVASEMGASIMVAHAPFRWERRARGWLRSGEADARAADLGVAFGMENLYPVAGRAFSTVITPAELAEHPNVVFDTSHFAVAGVDLFEAWTALRERVIHLHVSDNFGNGKDDHAPVGSGVLPLDSFLAHVGRSGYRGSVTLELDCRAHLDSRDSLVRFLSGERMKVEALLAGEESAEPAELTT